MHKTLSVGDSSKIHETKEKTHVFEGKEQLPKLQPGLGFLSQEAQSLGWRKAFLPFE